MGINGRLTLHFWLTIITTLLGTITYSVPKRHFWVDDLAPFTVWRDMLVPWRVIKKRWSSRNPPTTKGRIFSWTIRCRIRCPNINQYGANWVAQWEGSFFLCNAIYLGKTTFFQPENHRKLWIDGVGKLWLQQKAWTKKIEGLCLNYDQSLSWNLFTTHVGMFVYVHLRSFVF